MHTEMKKHGFLCLSQRLSALRQTLVLLLTAALTLVHCPRAWADVTATWDFTTDGKIQNTTGTYASDVSGIVLDIDATNGSFGPETSKAQVQIGAGTIIKIPVISTSDVITITNYSSSSNNATYTVGTEEGINVQEKTYSPTSDEVTAGYVAVTVTGSGYWKKLSVQLSCDAYVTTLDELNAALTAAADTSPYRIYLSNGTYDYGTTYGTKVPKGTSLIGQSRDGVIIMNTPTTEGLGTTPTLELGSNVSLSNLTVKCRAPYDSASKAERGACIEDKGTGNTYTNVCLDGLQDTYYSHGSAFSNTEFNTFTNCIIRGTVDFICGSGNITFNQCTLEVYPNHSSGGTPVICAPATFTTESQGYLFDGCTIKAASTAAIDCSTSSASTHNATAVADGGYWLGRAWYAGTDGTDRTPRATFKNTIYDITPKSALWTTMSDSQPGGAPVLTETQETSYLANLAAGKTATWDWQNGNPESITTVAIQNTTGTVKSNIPGIVLTVDATIGKFNSKDRTGDVQINANTVVQIPIFRVGDVVTIVSYPGYYKYFTVDDEQATENTTTVTATSAHLKAGCVALKATDTAYLYSITVQYAAKSADEENTGSSDNTGNSGTGSSTTTSFTNQEANVTWPIGNEATATYADAIAPAIKLTSRTVGTKIVEFRTALDVDPDKYADFQLKPGNRKPGSLAATTDASTYASYTLTESTTGVCEATTMIEYTLKMQQGVTFTLSSIEFTAMKESAADNIQWSYLLDNGAESTPQTVLDDASVNVASTYTENVNAASGANVVKVRFYLSNCTAGSKIYIGNVIINGVINGTPEVLVSAWTTAYSWESPAGTAIQTGGVATCENFPSSGSDRVNYANSTYFTLCLNGKKDNIDDTKASNNATYIKIALDEELQAGDYILVTGYRNKNVEGNKASIYFRYETADGTMKTTVADTQAYANIYSDNTNSDYDSDGSVLTTHGYVVPDAAVGSTVIKLTRNDAGTNLFITKFVIKRQTEIYQSQVTTHTVTYYDADGKVVATEVVTDGSALAYNAEATAAATPAVGSFKYWADAGGYYQVEEGFKVFEDLNLYAYVTRPIEGFAEFKIDFRTNPYSVTLPESGLLPTAVVVTNKGDYHGKDHGTQKATVTVTVQGPTKFTFGGCAFTNQATISYEGPTIQGSATVNTLTNTDGTDVYWIYNFKEGATITFSLGNYCHTFGGQPIEYIEPCTVNYYNQNNELVHSEEVVGGVQLEFSDYAEELITVPEGQKFRGWYYKTNGAFGTRATEGVPVETDLQLYAKVTDIEEPGYYTYDLTNSLWYLEEHDCIRMTGGRYYNTHGWTFSSSGSEVQLDLPGNARVTLYTCLYSSDGTTTIYDATDKTALRSFSHEQGKGTDGDTIQIDYEGPATTIYFVPTTYLHKIVIAQLPTPPSITTVNELDAAVTTTLETPEEPKNFGTVTVVRASTATGSLKANEKVTIVAEAAYGYEVSGFTAQGVSTSFQTSEVTLTDGTKKELPNITYTLPGGTSTVTVSYTRKELHKVTASFDDQSKGRGTISLTTYNDNFFMNTSEGGAIGYYEAGSNVTASVEAVAGYVVSAWKEGDVEDNTRSTYTLNSIAADHVLTVMLQEGKESSVLFLLGDADGASATYRGATSLKIGDYTTAYTDIKSFVVPTNYTLYKEGCTLTHWTDASGNVYYPGKTYSFSSNEDTLRLTPAFEANTIELAKRTSTVVLRYDFTTQLQSYADPNTDKSRNVCAQPLKVADNCTFYWTAQSTFTALSGGSEVTAACDIPMAISTGTKGFMRNMEMADWASFGPATTLWLTSCSGAKVSLLTYGPISSTTIDGVVPTLDTDDERCTPDRNQYVYSYTANETDELIPLVIGADDYSYYRWLEVSMPAASMVPLYVTVDDDTHATVESVKSIGTYAAEKITGGGYSFHQGEKVRVAVRRTFGYQLDKIVDLDSLDVDGQPLPVLQMNADNDNVTMAERDNYHRSTTVGRSTDANGYYVWGDDDNTLCKLTAVEDGGRTQYQLEFTISVPHRLQFYFKEKPTYYVTYNPGTMAEGTAPSAESVEEGDSYTIPKNTTLYCEGYTLDHWESEEGQAYKIGQSYTALGENLRLFPVFVVNKFNLLTLTDEATATWEFRTGQGAPVISYETTAGILVTQLKNGSDQIDVKIDLDATKYYNSDGKEVYGKFNNESSTSQMQVNPYSKIYYTATPGCVLTMAATSTIKGGLSVSDATKTTNANNNKTVIIECKGTNAAGILTVTNSVKLIYAKTFAITYKKVDATTLPSLSGATLTVGEETMQLTKDDFKNNVYTCTLTPSGSGDVTIPTVAATASNSGTVTVSQASMDNLTATINIATAGGITVETYTVQFEVTTPTAEADLPRIKSLTINGTACTQDEEGTWSATLTEQPVSGTIVVEFSRTMAATTLTFDDEVYQDQLSALQGSTQTFTYWHLNNGVTWNLSIPFGTFRDIYNAACPDVISVSLSTTQKQSAVEHRVFDYVVTDEENLNAIIEEINADASGTTRCYVFIPDGNYHLTGHGSQSANEKNDISRANVSLIGQSNAGTLLWNLPTKEQISITATIGLTAGATGFYAEEMQWVNTYPYNASESAGRAAAFQDAAGLSILKDVGMWSYQDTYYSTGTRSYLETCQLAGVVDWVCGHGDMWFEQCDIVIRDRDGNNFVAPNTTAAEKWGYVFNQCNFKPEGDNMTKLTNKNWTLGRPWQNSPAATFLNTKMYILPRDYGWLKMNGGLVLRFHEYNSMDAAGNAVNMGGRTLASCSPAPGSDDCVLNATQAAQYTLRNVLSGSDAYDPQVYTRQIDAASNTTGEVDLIGSLTWADDIAVDGNNLTWTVEEQALCYFIFKKDDAGKWVYKANVAQTEGATTMSVSLDADNYGPGTYYVRAANQRGGLGAPTKEVEYVTAESYALDLSQSSTINGYVWSTLCLPFNAKPENTTSVAVYAATQIADYMMTLKSVSVVTAGEGYVVRALKPGIYAFTKTTQSCTESTILVGNPESKAIDRGNNNCYVLGNKASSYGLGFYRYTGATLAANRAWLPIDSIPDNTTDNTSMGTASGKPISLRILTDEGDVTDIITVRPDDAPAAPRIFDLYGLPVQKPVPGRIYIVDGKRRVWRE